MTLEELAAEVAALKTQVPTLEEQLFSTVIPCWNNGADKIEGPTAVTLLVAPIPLRVLSVAFSWEYWTLAASDTRFWRAELNKGTGPGGFTVFATRSTQITGAHAGGGVTARKAWTFDAAAWTPGGADLAAGELLRVTASPIGDPLSSWDLPMTATIRYRPL